AEAVYGLVEQASAFGSAGIVVVTLFGLFTRIGGGRAAVAALTAGVASWIVGAYLLDLPYPYLGSLLLTVLVYSGTAGLARELRVDSAAT
ncbi:MAG: hypothetical protein ACRELC_09590, partial [Gemmatimonadota bacterium]